MQYLLMIYQNEAEYAKNDAATSQKMLSEYQTFTQSIIPAMTYGSPAARDWLVVKNQFQQSDALYAVPCSG